MQSMDSSTVPHRTTTASSDSFWRDSKVVKLGARRNTALSCADALPSSVQDTTCGTFSLILLTSCPTNSPMTLPELVVSPL